MIVDPSQIPGYGVDADPSRRPGIPKEKRPPAPLPGAVPPPPQDSAVRQFKHGNPAREYPAVYGTAQPARGLSGRLRALAYRYPDHLVRHWMMLLVSDRVDVWEHRLRGMRGIAAVAGVAGLVFASTLAIRALRA